MACAGKASGYYPISAPHTTEIISYSVPAFYDGYMLVGLGVTKNHISFYTMSAGLVKMLKEDLKEIKSAGFTLHFLPDKTLPSATIKRS